MITMIASEKKSIGCYDCHRKKQLPQGPASYGITLETLQSSHILPCAMLKITLNGQVRFVIFRQ